MTKHGLGLVSSNEALTLSFVIFPIVKKKTRTNSCVLTTKQHKKYLKKTNLIQYTEYLWGFPLGQRLKDIRARGTYLKGSSASTRRRQLDGLGFVWEPKRGRPRIRSSTSSTTTTPTKRTKQKKKEEDSIVNI